MFCGGLLELAIAYGLILVMIQGLLEEECLFLLSVALEGTRGPNSSRALAKCHFSTRAPQQPLSFIQMVRNLISE